MTISEEAQKGVAPQSYPLSVVAKFISSPGCAWVILLTAALIQSLGHLNCDVAWFLTFSEKVLDGATAYKDVSDPNPPAAFLAGAPVILLARWLGFVPEPLLIIFTFIGAVVSILLSGAILKKAGLLARQETASLFNALLFALLVVPAHCFAEREQFALIAMLPVLALCMARIEGKGAGLVYAFLAGLGAGVAVAFKPYYALPLVLAYGCVILRRSSRLAACWPEVLAAAAVVSAYGMTIMHFFPAYLTDTLSVIRDVYVPAREMLSNILLMPYCIVNMALIAGLLIAGWKHLADARFAVALAASAGFFATFLFQSKGWMNHAYPGVALALIAAVFFLLQRDIAEEERETRRKVSLYVLLPSVFVAPFLFGLFIDLANKEEYPGVKAAMMRLAPAHPKMLVLAEQMDIGFPLVRDLRGTWVGRQNCLWITYDVKYLLARGVSDPVRREALLRYKAADEAMFAEDIQAGKPDVLLTETPELEDWARKEPALQPIFEGYRFAQKVGLVSIWLRESDTRS